jgi:hypothetical protein
VIATRRLKNCTRELAFDLARRQSSSAWSQTVWKAPRVRRLWSQSLPMGH